MNINDELINDNNEGLFFEYGAHFKYRDLYDRLYILSKNINNENWKKKKSNTIVNKMNNNSIIKRVSRNPKNIYNNKVSFNNESIILYLKKMHNITLKNKLSDSYKMIFKNCENKISKSETKNKNKINNKRNNVLNVFLNQKIIVKKNINLKKTINNDYCPKSSSQSRNLSSSISKKLHHKNLFNENKIKSKISNYLNLYFSKIINKKINKNKTSNIKNKSFKSNINIIIPISGNCKNNSEKGSKKKIKEFLSKSNINESEEKKLTNNQNNIIIKQKKINQNHYNLYFQTTSENLSKTKGKNTNNNHNVNINNNNKSCKNKKYKDNEILILLLEKKNKKKKLSNNISISKEKKFSSLKHSIFPSNRNSTMNTTQQNKNSSNSNIKNPYFK